MLESLGMNLMLSKIVFCVILNIVSRSRAKLILCALAQRLRKVNCLRTFSST